MHLRPKKSLAPWTSLPDSPKPHLSSPPVWKFGKHRKLAERLEKNLVPGTSEAGTPPKMQRTEQEKDKASRKRWIIGLSTVALLLAYVIGDGCIKDYKRFNKANRSATGQVVEVDPGEPGHPGPDGDAGQPPSSHYQFNVNGITYDGWLKDELGEGEKVLVRYNSSNPEFNHADGDQPFWRDHSHAVWFIAFAIVAWSLVKVVRDRDFLREDSF
jgi:hypothetical protein